MQQRSLKPECRDCSPKGDCTAKYCVILRKRGGRLTNERMDLLRIVCDTKGHFRPESVARRLKPRGRRVSLATVYRNLSLLVEAGIIRRTDTQGSPSEGAIYEHVWGRDHHDHLICTRCGRKVEFRYPAIEVLQEAVASEHGFTLERHNLELLGVCADCAD